MANKSASPVNHGQCLSDTTTSSRCVTGSVTATHTFEVTNFSLLDGMGIGKYIDSSTFSAGGQNWNIRVYPDGWKEENKAVYVSVFLNLNRGAEGVRAKYSMSLLDKHGHVSKLVKDTHTFQWATGFWGWDKYMEKSKLQPLLDLNNDCFTIRCDLTVIQDPRTEAVARTVLVPQSNLQQHFERMLKDGRGTDVTFSVSGELFHAHRCLLAARSPVFEAELFGPVKEVATQPIRIDDMEPTIFEVLLHFIYTDICNASGNAVMQHLLVAADRYGLDRLKAICEDKLCNAIDVETVATTLTLAEQHNCVQLKDGCLRFIIASREVLGAVMKTEGFSHLVASCPLLMKEILDKMAGVSNDKLNLGLIPLTTRDEADFIYYSCLCSEVHGRLNNGCSLCGRPMSSSIVGGTKDIQEMVKFCVENKIYPEIGIIKMDYINEALARLVTRDVKYRFVIDIKNSFK